MKPVVDDGLSQEKFFPITYLHKDDMRKVFSGNREMLKKVEKLDDNDMTKIANKMGDHYTSFTVNFWDSLERITEEYVKSRKRG